MGGGRIGGTAIFPIFPHIRIRRFLQSVFDRSPLEELPQGGGIQVNVCDFVLLENREIGFFPRM
ncbi:hypothetical protein LEP1GSC058_2730 [Leptospira fainei serovar Hurstbridge str. BUT 6]|uniref:Uncharacterized protein n=1 Tax=Leptospira fainei serovar Hurstbridge str. BUT 6 TaxID=1193011 RepID=S3VBE6_9LEPT|nr:hypothetical protein LEP1GSC058_2730 [Leptospira fainei serovar Hurstbridge str. BUT 6]